MAFSVRRKRRGVNNSSVGTLEPVVVLYRLEQSVESSVQVKISSPGPARRTRSIKLKPGDLLDTNSLVQEEPEPPQIKEGHEGLLQRPDKADGSTQTLLVKSEEDDTENGDSAEPLASTSSSTEQNQTPRKHTCAFCEKGFSRMDNLRTHMRVHTGERPFTCEVCSKGFGQMGHLKDHMRVHTGEKPFVCTVCDKGCSQKKHLKKHMRIHTGEKPYVCTVCGAGCNQKSDLKRHVRTHTGEKPFRCIVCGKGCGRMSDMNRHMRIHTGEKPFSCTVCGKGCRQKSDLKKHMRTHAEKKL